MTNEPDRTTWAIYQDGRFLASLDRLENGYSTTWTFDPDGALTFAGAKEAGRLARDLDAALVKRSI